jgi:hypothetical protein
VQIAFYHTAASRWEGLGWYIDDVSVWKGIPTFINPETFEFGWQDLSTDYGVWEIGLSSVVPPSPVSGGNCAGTVLNGNYPADTDSRLIMSPVVLPISHALQLRFWQSYSYAGSDYTGYDAGHVQISLWDGSKWGPWTTIATPTAPNTSSPWSPVAVNLTPYAGQTVQIAFYHTAASRWESLGWYIDDVQITPAPETWLLSEDSGCSRTDKLTSDTTPEFTFVFPQAVRGAASDIQIMSPDGQPVAPDSVSGWGSGKVVASLTTPLAQDGEYAVTLKGTITDSQGKVIRDGVDKVLHFTLDTIPPTVTIDPEITADSIPLVTGTVDDPDAQVDVIIDANSYPARNNRDGTWMLPAETVGLDLFDGAHAIRAEATDQAGNKAFDDVNQCIVVYDFPLDSDPGWTRNGQWEFGIPLGQGGLAHGNPDPTAGHTGQYVLGVNLKGDHNNLPIGGPYSLTAGPFDLSSYRNVTVRFARWLNTDDPEYVKAGLDVSTDGMKSWTPAWEHTKARTDITDSQWVPVEYPVPQADNQSAVYLRWRYEIVAQRAYSYSGWNIDDIQLIGCIEWQ